MKANNAKKTLALARISPAIHFEGCVRILDKENRLVSPHCNILQRRMSQVYEVCMDMNVPCRMIVLKPRQVGCSTFSAEILYHHCRNYRTRAVQIADDLGNADNIFRIFCRHAEVDCFPWKTDFSATRTEGVFTNGSMVEKDTAQNVRAGISATRQGIHASEVAKWAVSGARSAQEVMGAMLNSLADVPRSVAIAESTPQGAAGWFYEQWRGGVDLDEFLNGKHGNGWIKVFAGWFEFEEHRADGASVDMDALDEREARGVRLYGWTREQIAWRRSTKSAKCGGSDRVLDEYYPEDDISCFVVSGFPRFEVENVAELENLAEQYPPKEGVLLGEEEDIQFEETSPTNAWVWLWELPKEGCRYIVSADLSVGENQSASDEGDPDRHSVLLLREEFQDEVGTIQPAMLAARIKPPTRAPFDILAEQADLLSRFYGRCSVAPEMNHSGMAFIERLKERGVPVYMRRSTSPATGKISQLEGWQTTSASRRLIIDELARRIREGELDVRCRHVVSELKTFVINTGGREEALRGCHDDDVLALAIGIHCLPSGSIFEKPKPQAHLEPADAYERDCQPRRGLSGSW